MKTIQTYKGQLYLLVLTVIIPVLTLWLSVGKTVSLYVRNVNQTSLLRELTTNPVSMGQMDKAQKIFRQSFPNYIFPIILKNNCIIDNYTPFITQNSGEYTLHTNSVTIKGDFIQILKIIEEIESTENSLKIISVDFSISTQTFWNKIPELKTKILIQHIDKQ